MGALGSNDVGDRYPGGRCGIGEPPGAVRDDALDDPAGDIRPEARWQPVDGAHPVAGRGGVDGDAISGGRFFG